MFRVFRKTLFTVLVALFWIWSLTNALAAISSKSDIGVVLGLVATVVATFLAVWLMAKILRRKPNESNSSRAGRGGIGGDGQ